MRKTTRKFSSEMRKYAVRSTTRTDMAGGDGDLGANRPRAANTDGGADSRRRRASVGTPKACTAHLAEPATL